MSYVKIWIHLVFTTKNRVSFLTKQNKKDILKHIVDNALKKEIHIKTINGDKEHIHCLISLGRDQSIAQVSQLIKGEVSFWINKNRITPFKFAWQDDYFAVSVSESLVDVVKKYILNQENHHKKKLFTEEVDEFLKKYGFVLIKD